MKTRIAIDLDNVIWDLSSSWLECYNEKTGENVKPEDITDYDIGKFVEKPYELFNILYSRIFWQHINIEPAIIKTITSLKNHGVDIKIVTATDYEIARPKFDRLLELIPALKKEDLIIAYDKSWIDAEWLIDDNPANLKSYTNNRILIDQPYNRGVLDYYYDYRAKDLIDAISFIIKYLE